MQFHDTRNFQRAYVFTVHNTVDGLLGGRDFPVGLYVKSKSPARARGAKNLVDGARLLCRSQYTSHLGSWRNEHLSARGPSTTVY